MNSIIMLSAICPASRFLGHFRTDLAVVGLLGSFLETYKMGLTDVTWLEGSGRTKC